MVQIRVLSGNKAGTELVTRRFPLKIGRAGNSDLRLEDAGVWDEHLRIYFEPRNGYVLQTCSDALASINSQPQSSARLRNGDTITAGSVQLQFWLAEAAQRRLTFRETFTWVMIGAICVAQVALVYLLIRL